ncbi:BMP family lipoprotein [Modestobacter versicolor]|uniref:BMP family lipoprotein n=1 Tax=Modestobacter versicolor TaxID=429133 RepID=UPI0021AC96F4|nr:BMP family ABC transporter substrate-binding protein [Modestobacter versicolor]
MRGMKAAALLLAGSMALAACASDEDDSASGGSSESSSASGDLRIGLAYDTGGRGDKSFNDSAYAGVEAAIASLGGEVQELSPNDDASNRPELLTQLAEQGFDPVIAVGFAYGDIISDIAADFPDTTFAIIDSTGVDLGEGNVTGLQFAANEGSFLAGVAAALKSTTNYVGFVGGVETPLIQSFEAGFAAGAEAAKPGITVDVKYISPAGDFSGFSDPARGQIVAQGIFDAGADIVYHAAGGSGTGVFEAAAASGKRAIGVDSDQYQTVDDPAQQAVIMTSMLKRVDNAVEAFITDFSEGNVEGGTDITNDLETEGVGLSYSGGFIDDIKTQIDEFAQQIIDGEIEVPTAP